MEDDEFDLFPAFVVRILAIGSGGFVFTVIVSYIPQSIFHITQSFAYHLEENLNRLGLIFQLLGLFSVLPDLLEKKQEAIWEKRLQLFGEKLNRNNFSFTNLIRTLTVVMIGRADGLMGFVIYVSNTIAFVIVHIAVFFIFPWALRPTYKLIYLLDIVLLFASYSWLTLEILIWRYRATSDVEWSYPIKRLRSLMFLVCGGIFVFFPILLITLPIAYLLKWSSKHSLRFVFITTTFPFILTGILCQLIASFL